MKKCCAMMNRLEYHYRDRDEAVAIPAGLLGDGLLAQELFLDRFEKSYPLLCHGRVIRMVDC